tara:strand:- start:198 stop:476 length:279 start_codon:yes stop_codon:yes gene_type:complete
MYSDKAVNKYREKHGLNTEPRQEVEILMSMSRETTKGALKRRDKQALDRPWAQDLPIIKKNTRPQMKHGGMHKGKQHSYVAGGAVKDARSKK